MTLETPSTKGQLVIAATALLDEGGAELITMRAVAMAVRVSHNAPYKHFKDKQALMAAVAQASFAAMSASFDETVRRMRSPIAALKAIIEQYIDFAERFPGRYRLLFNDVEIAVQGGELERVATGTFDLVVRLIQAAQSAGEIRDGDPHEFTGLLYGAVHGLVDLRLSGRATLNKGMQDIRLPCWRLVEMLAVKPSAQTKGHKPAADPGRNSKR